jgi:hypothetical protein
MLIVLFVTVQMSCVIEDAGAWRDRVRGSGDIERETRRVRGITGVELATIGTLRIEIGNEEKLIIEAEDNLLEYIETDVRRGVLKIDNDEDVSLEPRRRIRYYLTVKELEELAVSSSGDIIAPDLEADRFDISVSSSGDIDMGTLECEDLEIRISSSGDVHIEELRAETIEVGISSSGEIEIDDGSVEEQEISISSSGEYLAKHLDSERARVRVSSSGDAHVRVSEFLDARTSSSGDINYYGDPRLRSRETSSGDIHRVGR